MFIYPNSVVELYKGVKLNKEQNNTFYFETRGDQNAFFSTLWSYVSTQFTFVREDETIRMPLNTLTNPVGISYADLFECNYMRFNNTQYYNKWFYAFIDKIEWINNGMAKIYYTIDPMQTWLIDYDYNVMPCYVVREHSATDEIGDNILDEGLALGEYIYGDRLASTLYNVHSGNYEDMATSAAPFLDMSIVLALSMKCEVTFTYDTQGNITSVLATPYPNESPMQLWGFRNISGLTFVTFPDSEAGIKSLGAVLNQLTTGGYGDNIVAAFWYPTIFANELSGIDITDPNLNLGPNLNATIRFIREFTNTYKTKGSVNEANVDGYVPRNRKLFTYPYTYLAVITSAGEKIFRLEYFSNGVHAGNNGYDGTCQISYLGALSPIPIVEMWAYDYASSTQGQAAAPYQAEIMTITDFPPIMVVNDLWYAYMAQVLSGMGFHSANESGPLPYSDLAVMNQMATAAESILSGLSPAKGVEGNIVGGISSLATSGYDGIRKTLTALGRRELNRYEPLTNAGSPITLQDYKIEPKFIYKTIKSDFARIIDDYFTVYGYACNRVKRINTCVRENFTYVKTIGGTIELEDVDGSGMSTRFEDEIIAILNKGIAFWRVPSNIGNYFVSNRPLSEVQT